MWWMLHVLLLATLRDVHRVVLVLFLQPQHRFRIQAQSNLLQVLTLNPTQTLTLQIIAVPVNISPKQCHKYVLFVFPDTMPRIQAKQTALNVLLVSFNSEYLWSVTQVLVPIQSMIANHVL